MNGEQLLRAKQAASRVSGVKINDLKNWSGNPYGRMVFYMFDRVHIETFYIRGLDELRVSVGGKMSDIIF